MLCKSSLLFLYNFINLFTQNICYYYKKADLSALYQAFADNSCNRLLYDITDVNLAFVQFYTKPKLITNSYIPEVTSSNRKYLPRYNSNIIKTIKLK